MKYFLLIASVLSVFSVVSVQAQAQSSVATGKQITDWTFMADAPGEWIDAKNETHALDAPVKFYYALDTVARADDIVKLWAKWDYARGMGSLVQEYNFPQDFYSMRVYLVLDCRRSEMGAITMLLYDKAGKMVRSGTTDEQPKEIAGTLGSGLLEYFCERPTGKPTQAPTLKVIP